MAQHVIFGAGEGLKQIVVLAVVDAVPIRKGDPHRPQLLPGDPLPDGFDDLHSLRLVGARLQEKELVSADPGDQILLPADLPEYVRRRAEHAIAIPVSDGIVHQLEPVHVEEHNRHRGHVRGPVFHDHLFKIRAVVQSGQRVMIKKVLDARPVVEVVGDVAYGHRDIIPLGGIRLVLVPVVQRRGIMGEMLRDAASGHIPQTADPEILRHGEHFPHALSDHILPCHAGLRFKGTVDSQYPVIHRPVLLVIDHLIVRKCDGQMLKQQIQIFPGD